MNRENKPRDSKRLTVALASLVSVFVVAAFLHGLTLPGTIESQVYAALGCRSFDSVLILELTSDGRVRWPDGHDSSLEEAQVLIPAWSRQEESPVLALLADKNAPMSLAHPLLATAQDLGMRRAILATSTNAAPTVLTDAPGTQRLQGQAR